MVVLRRLFESRLNSIFEQLFLFVGKPNEEGVEACPKECCFKLMTVDEIINGKVSASKNIQILLNIYFLKM